MLVLKLYKRLRNAIKYELDISQNKDVARVLPDAIAHFKPALSMIVFFY